MVTVHIISEKADIKYFWCFDIYVVCTCSFTLKHTRCAIAMMTLILTSDKESGSLRWTIPSSNVFLVRMTAYGTPVWNNLQHDKNRILRTNNECYNQVCLHSPGFDLMGRTLEWNLKTHRPLYCKGEIGKSWLAIFLGILCPGWRQTM